MVVLTASHARRSRSHSKVIVLLVVECKNRVETHIFFVEKKSLSKGKSKKSSSFLDKHPVVFASIGVVHNSARAVGSTTHRVCLHTLSKALDPRLSVLFFAYFENHRVCRATIKKCFRCPGARRHHRHHHLLVESSSAFASCSSSKTTTRAVVANNNNKRRGSSQQLHATVVINHEGKDYTVEVQDGETILEAGLDAGMTYDTMMMGVCMMCPAKRVSGEVEQPNAMLSDDVVDQGFVLLCCSNQSATT